jgi:CRP-like cAMP-binding protein
MTQGTPGSEMYLVLDGVFVVEVDGREVAEVGPGAVVGERSVLENGTRTATVRARTKCRVAALPRRYADDRELAEIARGHRREEAR